MKKNGTFKKFIILCMVFVLLLTTVSCSTVNVSFRNFRNAFFSKEERDTIKIALFEPLSGVYAQQANPELQGATVANRLKNEIIGKEVELVLIDSKSDIFEGEEALNYNLTSDFSAAIGSYGDVLTLLLVKKAEELMIPSLTVSSRNALVTKNNRFAFTTTYLDDTQGLALSQVGYYGHHVKHFAVIRIETDDTQTSTIDQFRSDILSHKDTICESVNLSIDQTDYMRTIETLMENNVGAVFLALPESSAKSFISQAKSLNYYPLYLGTRVWDTPTMIKYLETAGIDCEVVTEDIKFDASPAGKLFLAEYKELYGALAEPGAQALRSFDAYMLLIKAIENAYVGVMSVTKNEFMEKYDTTLDLEIYGRAYDETKKSGIPSGVLIKDALLQITNYQGLSGMISYGGTNVASRGITVTHFERG